MGLTVRHSAAAALAASLIGAALFSPGPASAAAAEPRSPGDTPCTVEYDATLSPGPSLTSGTGSYTTGGETGTIACVGTVDGKRVTGIGTWGEAGRYGVAKPYGCTDVSGDAVQRTSLTLPTDHGPLHLVDDPTHLTFGPLQGGGVIGGTFSGSRVYGSFTLLPVQGDCVTAPITKMHVWKQAWITEK